MQARRFVPGVLVVIAAVCMTGCSKHRQADTPTLRVSAIPDQAPDRVVAQHRALVDQVCLGAGVNCVWVEFPTYEALVDAFGNGNIDLAYLGGVTFAQAHARHGAVAVAMRDIDPTFTSSIVVRANDPARRIEDLRGRRFAFGARSSTSGHHMPRHFLRLAGFAPERDFGEPVFSGGHDQTLRMILGGEVAAGVVNSSILDREFARRPDVAGRLRVIWESPPFTDYVWAVRRGFAPELRERLLNAFLDLEPSNAAWRGALEAEAALGYLPADPVDFAVLIALLRESGQL